MRVQRANIIHFKQFCVVSIFNLLLYTPVTGDTIMMLMDFAIEFCVIFQIYLMKKINFTFNRLEYVTFQILN